MAAALLDGDISAHGASGRTLEYALVASLGLHLALFVVFPAVHFATLEPPPKQSPLVARLEPAQPAPAAVPQVPVAAPPEPRKPPAKPVVHRPPAKPLARVKPVRKAPPPPAPPQPVAAVAEAPPVAPVAPPAAPAAATQPIARIAPQTAAPAAMAEQASEVMLAQYRLAVIEAARRYKRYPPVALDNNWQGRAEVRMAIGADGTIAALSVRSSSGHEILDREALDMIRKAKPVTPIPTSLRGTAFTVDIPVVFSLEAPES